MEWNTIYLRGKGDFWEAVKLRLEKTAIQCMPGNMEQLADGTYQGLYWLDDQANIQDLKETIGASLIWKHRLRFYVEDEINQPDEALKKARFTERERTLIKKMRSIFKKKALAL